MAIGPGSRGPGTGRARSRWCNCRSPPAIANPRTGPTTRRPLRATRHRPHRATRRRPPALPRPRPRLPRRNPHPPRRLRCFLTPRLPCVSASSERRPLVRVDQPGRQPDHRVPIASMRTTRAENCGLSRKLPLGDLLSRSSGWPSGTLRLPLQISTTGQQQDNDSVMATSLPPDLTHQVRQRSRIELVENEQRRRQSTS